MLKETSAVVHEKQARRRAKLIDEVRARITWGESPEATVDWMLEQDASLDADEARELVASFSRIRASSMRRHGIRDFAGRDGCSWRSRFVWFQFVPISGRRWDKSSCRFPGSSNTKRAIGRSLVFPPRS